MTLPPHEQIVLDRLAESNPLGWKPKGRTEEGYGILETVLPAGPGKLKVCRVVLHPNGMCHDSRQRIIDAR
jgi:hypothetical protein